MCNLLQPVDRFDPSAALLYTIRIARRVPNRVAESIGEMYDRRLSARVLHELKMLDGDLGFDEDGVQRRAVECPRIDGENVCYLSTSRTSLVLRKLIADWPKWNIVCFTIVKPQNVATLLHRKPIVVYV